MDIFCNHTLHFHQIKVDFQFFLPKHVVYISIINKRQSMTACGYCFIFVEYCSEKAMLYKMLRGK